MKNNTVFRGIKNLVYAEVMTDGAEGITFGAVKRLAGVKSVEVVPEVSSDTVYYDNVPSVNIDTEGKSTITIACSAIPLETLADISGKTYDASNKALIGTERKQKYFALGYIASTADDKDIYIWNYKGTFGIPSDSFQTKDASAGYTEGNLTYTSIMTQAKFGELGNEVPVKDIRVSSENAAITASAFFADVYTPNKLPSTVSQKK